MWSAARPSVPTLLSSSSYTQYPCGCVDDALPSLMGCSSAGVRLGTRWRVVHAQHELSADEAPFRGDDAVDLAASAQAVMTPFTEVRHRSRDVVLLSYTVHAEPSSATWQASCTTVSIDRHWLTLRTALLTPTAATILPHDGAADLSVRFDHTSPCAAQRAGSFSSGSQPRCAAKTETAQTSNEDEEEKRSFLVFSTRWRHEDALLLTDDEYLVRVLRSRQQPEQHVVALSRNRLFSVAVSDAQGHAGASTRGGPLQRISSCTLTDDITVNALCAAHWGPFGTLVGSSDGSLKLIDWRVPSRSAVVLETPVPQPMLGGRRHTACVLSCCALSVDGCFRVACGLGAANGEVAVADLRRVALSESVLCSRRRVRSQAAARQRALLSGALSSPTGAPIAEMQLLPDGGAGSASLSLGMVDVCGTVLVASVADLEHQRTSWCGRRSRGAPTRSRGGGDEDEEEEEEEEVETNTAVMRRRFTSLHRQAGQVPLPPPPLRLPTDVEVILVDDDDDDDDNDENVREVADLLATTVLGELSEPTSDATHATVRRRAVAFSTASAGLSGLGGRLPSPDAVASAWPWRAAVRGVASRSPSFAVSSPTLRASGPARLGDSGRAGPPAARLGSLAPAPRRGPATTVPTRSLSTTLSVPRWTSAAPPRAAPAASPAPSLGVLSSTDLRCTVLSDPAWTGGTRGQSVLVATQPSSACTSWYDTHSQTALGELVPLVGGAEPLTERVLQQGQYVVGLSALGPLLCVETARGGTYCVLPEGD